MKNQNFELEASEYFLCKSKKYSIFEQYELLKKAKTKIPNEVIVWKPFIHYTLNELRDQIDKFAFKIKRIYESQKQ